MIDSWRVQQRINRIFVVAWMCLIYGFSGQNAAVSSQVSGGLVDLAARVLEFVLTFFSGHPHWIDLDLLTYLIRKGAHTFLYTVLGALVSLALCPERKISWRVLLKSVLICFLYACSDEFHQLFVAGRSCEWGDIFIDTCGSIIGSGLVAFYKKALQ